MTFEIEKQGKNSGGKRGSRKLPNLSGKSWILDF
jgi:hypothetical protein